MARAILLAFFLVGIAQMVYYYPQLPDVVASHFEGSGEANGWSSKASFLGIIGGVGAIMVLSFLALPALIHRLPPSMVNMPNKAYWLAPERRDETRVRMAESLAWMGVGTMALLIYVTQLTIDANLGPPPPKLDGSFGWVLGGYFAFVALWTVYLYRAFALPADGDRLRR